MYTCKHMFTYICIRTRPPFARTSFSNTQRSVNLEKTLKDLLAVRKKRFLILFFQTNFTNVQQKNKAFLLPDTKINK